MGEDIAILQEDDTRDENPRIRESENPRIRENDKRTTMPEDDNVEGRESERTRREENVGGQECKRITRRCTGVSKMAMSQ